MKRMVKLYFTIINEGGSGLTVQVLLASLR